MHKLRQKFLLISTQSPIKTNPNFDFSENIQFFNGKNTEVSDTQKCNTH